MSDARAVIKETTADANSDVLARWYVVHCKMLRERGTAEALQTYAGVTCYVPYIRRRGKDELKESPLFPGYFFVKADLENMGKSRINSTLGVVRLLEFGSGPQPLPDSLIEGLRERVAQVNASGGLLPTRLNPGDPIWIKSGRLRGLEALFVKRMAGTARVRVLLQLLGRLNEVEVDADEVEPANTSPIVQRERRTRGGGRKVNHPTAKAGGFYRRLAPPVG